MNGTLYQRAIWEKGAAEPILKASEQEGSVPEDFYSTSNHRTEVFFEGLWRKVDKQRMEAMIRKTREGYFQGLLGGNAIAVHDLESCFYGTFLGVDMTTGKPTHGGHYHHMKAINKIKIHGSIKAAIEAGELTGGLMYELENS